MKRQTFGATVAALRKDKGLTQLELADRMGVTDKAVSKWERDLSLPDTASLPKLAETLGVSVDDLMQGQAAPKARPDAEEAARLVSLILKSVALAMGVACATLSFLGQIDGRSAAGLLGIGLACLAADQLSRQ